jgi:hypothetical protein
MGRISRICSRPDRSSANDAQDDDGIVYAVESVDKHHIVFLDSGMFEAGDELADEDFGLSGCYVVGRIKGVNINLGPSQS